VLLFVDRPTMQRFEFVKHHTEDSCKLRFLMACFLAQAFAVNGWMGWSTMGMCQGVHGKVVCMQ
jgi:hypothetical protein